MQQVMDVKRGKAEMRMAESAEHRLAAITAQ